MAELDLPQTSEQQRVPRLLWDAGTFLGLLVALAGVYAFDSLSYKIPQPPDTPVSEDPVAEGRPLRLAVTIPPHQFDDIGHVLEQLGEGYDFKTIDLEHLRNGDLLG